MSGLAWWLRRDPVLLMPAERWGGNGRTRAAGPRGPSGLLPSAERRWLTFSGSAALHASVAALGLEPGEGVLFPAYNCGHEIEPFLRRGLWATFYPIGRDLAVDAGEVERRIGPGVRAVLVTHYFGFPQELSRLRSVCDRRGVLLIEDCAHALLSARDGLPVGATGDACVFSLRKTLPLPDGGALLVRRPAVAEPELREPPALPVLLKRLELVKKSLLQASSRSGWALSRASLAGLAPALWLRDALEARHPGRRALWFDPDYEEFDYPSEVLTWRMSRPATAALGRADPARIVRSRRSNYAALLTRVLEIPGAEPLFPELPAGVCPLFFPLLVDQPMEIVRRLRGAGISAAPWWEEPHPVVPWEEHPGAAELKRRVVVLPVHQFLSAGHMERAGDALGAALR